ncbi:tripartite tricarboxylate transporter TctB family protein [Bengtsoniella intestinalis]|uniref:tripartite tricarboxylate transporter TctB family protein n=1 Tax=Bengtsoniella intestinalis TaxID=3073143 RepID=UPI00391FB16F
MKKISGLALGCFFTLLFIAVYCLIPYGIKDATTGVMGARFIPKLLFIGGALIAAVFAVVFRKECYEVDLKVYPMVIGLFVYYFLVLYIGFLISTLLMMMAYGYLWGVRNPKILVGLGIGTPVMLYVFFEILLSISLPSGLLF